MLRLFVLVLLLAFLDLGDQAIDVVWVARFCLLLLLFLLELELQLVDHGVNCVEFVDFGQVFFCLSRCVDLVGRIDVPAVVTANLLQLQIDHIIRVALAGHAHLIVASLLYEGFQIGGFAICMLLTHAF